MSGQVRDMTKGSPGRLIILFAIPLMLGNICQQLYTMVDTIVVGQIAGVQALAALGAVEWITWMVLGVSTGATQGFSILISQHYGAKKRIFKTVCCTKLCTYRRYFRCSSDSQPDFARGSWCFKYSVRYYRYVSDLSADCILRNTCSCCL